MSKNRYVFVHIIFLLSLFLCGCGIQVPAEKEQYVGEWRAPEMYLLITRDGSVEYKRIKGGARTSVSGPIRAFEGNNFSVGLPLISTTFVVSRVPYEENGQWKMVVDGIVLTRTW